MWGEGLDQPYHSWLERKPKSRAAAQRKQLPAKPCLELLQLRAIFFTVWHALHSSVSFNERLNVLNLTQIKTGKVKAMALAPWVRSFQPNSRRQQHRVCLLQIHRLIAVSVQSFHTLGLGKAKECKWCQHPIWTFASYWHYLPTKTHSAGANLSAPQRGCISPSLSAS